MPPTLSLAYDNFCRSVNAGLSGLLGDGAWKPKGIFENSGLMGAARMQDLPFSSFQGSTLMGSIGTGVPIYADVYHAGVSNPPGLKSYELHKLRDDIVLVVSNP